MKPFRELIENYLNTRKPPETMRSFCKRVKMHHMYLYLMMRGDRPGGSDLHKRIAKESGIPVATIKASLDATAAKRMTKGKRAMLTRPATSKPWSRERKRELRRKNAKTRARRKAKATNAA